MLSFTLLGQVALFNESKPLSEFRSQKEVALLLYLAHTKQTHSREFIADLLWEGRSTQQSLSNLRTVLARVRKQAGDSLLVTRKSLVLAPESLQQVDSVRLLAGLTTVEQVDTAAKASMLHEILELYQGDFLANFTLPDAPQFEKWIITTREQIRRKVTAAYNKLGQFALSTGNAELGAEVARRWLEVDMLDEAAHILMIRLLLEDDQIRAAAAQYDHCIELLHKELGVEPSADLTALNSDVRPTSLFVEQLEPLQETPSQQVTQSPAIAPISTTIRHHNLPVSHDEFIGRVSAQQDIHARLDQPWCRLVTIVGQGGAGKTRLATTVARKRFAQEQTGNKKSGKDLNSQYLNSQYKDSQYKDSQYKDGVWLVELADVDPDDVDLTEAIAVEIATAIDLRLSGLEKPVEQLLTHLQHKKMLLLLDNFEHLIESGTQLVLDILHRSENIQLLVTSREALRVRAEWTIVLTGLGYRVEQTNWMLPAESLLGKISSGDRLSGETPPADVQSDAVELFVARRAQQQRGPIAANELAAIGQICQMVEGLPLAIELAAALTQNATPQQILDELHGGLNNGFESLATSLRDVPQRHRSLQTVFDMSWQTLTPSLQQRLAQLSVFRGGFTKSAAQQIADASAQDLIALADKSLLARDAAAERYTLHGVVGAFASTKQASTDQTPQKHAYYYLSLLAQHADPLQKNAPQESIAVLELDIANVRLAWQTGLDSLSLLPSQEWTREGLLLGALTSLSIYYQLRGLAREAEAVMQTTLNTAMEWGTDGLAFATRAGLERARFQNRLGRYRPAIETVETALKLAANCEDRWAEGMGHVLWGEALWRLGEYDAAVKKLTHALDIARGIDSTMLVGWCHHHLGVINDIQSRYDAARDHLEQACDAWRAIGNAQALSGSLNSIGLVCYNQDELPEAQQAMKQALTLCNQLDNRHLQSVLLNNLSMIYIRQHDYLSANHYLQLGLELATTNGNLTSQGEIYNNLGKNYFQLGKPELAVGNLRYGLEISESIGNRSLSATLLHNLADAERNQGGQEQAEALYSQALTIAEQDSLQYTECEILISMAENLSKTNEKQARQYCAKAIALAEAIRNPELLKRANAIDHYLTVSIDVNATKLSM